MIIEKKWGKKQAPWVGKKGFNLEEQLLKTALEKEEAKIEKEIQPWYKN